VSIAINEGHAVQRYTRTAMVLHWVVAVLIVGNVVLGLAADSLPEDWIRSAVDTHKSIGITVLGLAVLRLLWRFAHRPPPMPDSYARSERLVAHAAHVALYVLIFALPTSGWMHDSAWNGGATHPVFLYGVIPGFRYPCAGEPRSRHQGPPPRGPVHLPRLVWIRALRPPGPARARHPQAPVLGSGGGVAAHDVVTSSPVRRGRIHAPQNRHRWALATRKSRSTCTRATLFISSG